MRAADLREQAELATEVQLGLCLDDYDSPPTADPRPIVHTLVEDYGVEKVIKWAKEIEFEELDAD
jgi:hypothetical protein